MSYQNIPTRTSADANSAADINQLMANIELLAGNSGSVPDATIQEVYNNIQCLFYPSYQNLTAKPNTSNPNYQVDVSWDELRIENRRTTSKSFTLNITQSGALGLDTGSEAVSTWYYIWAICNDAGTTVSVILSASTTAPTLPSGYTKKRLISAVYNMADGHFRGFKQIDTMYHPSTHITIVEGSGYSALTEFDLTSMIPDIGGVHIQLDQQCYCANPTTGFNVCGYYDNEYLQDCYGYVASLYYYSQVQTYTTNRKIKLKGWDDNVILRFYLTWFIFNL